MKMTEQEHIEYLEKLLHDARGRIAELREVIKEKNIQLESQGSVVQMYEPMLHEKELAIKARENRGKPCNHYGCGLVCNEWIWHIGK